MFRDAKYKEYTYACGGRKAYETAVQGGNRELFEESNGMFENILKEDCRENVFFGSKRSREERRKDHREGIIVTMKYSIFFVEVVDEDYHKYFATSLSKNSETDECIVVTKDEIPSLKTWDYLCDEVYPMLL